MVESRVYRSIAEDIKAITKVAVEFTEIMQEFKPQSRTSIPVNKAGRCWRIGFELQISNPQLRYMCVGYCPVKEKCAFTAVKEAISSCVIIHGPIQLDLTKINGELSSKEKEILIKQFQ